MKKHFIATALSIVFLAGNALAYYGPNDKNKKPGKPKANCSPAGVSQYLRCGGARPPPGMRR